MSIGEDFRLDIWLVLATVSALIVGLAACESDPTPSPTRTIATTPVPHTVAPTTIPTMALTRATAAPAAPSATTVATPVATAMVPTATAAPTTAPALPSTPAQTDGLIPAAGSVSAFTSTFQGREFRLAKTKIQGCDFQQFIVRDERQGLL